MKNLMNKVIDILKKKWVKPKVYAIVLKVRGFQHLSLQAGYSLEEAFQKAKDSISKERIAGVTVDDVTLSKIDMFHHMEVDDLFKDFVEIKAELSEEETLTPNEKKNILMKRIVDTKDLKLLEDNRSVFSESEVKYLTGEINKK